MLTNHKEIKAWLDSMDIENYTINDAGTVTVEGDVVISGKGLTEIPVQFRIVYGYFSCGFNNLESLNGSPREVGGDFDCWNNSLTSLNDAPQEVGGNFNCINNSLTSLNGSPREVGGDFNCWNNSFTTNPNCDTIINGQLIWE